LASFRVNRQESAKGASMSLIGDQKLPKRATSSAKALRRMHALAGMGLLSMGLLGEIKILL
jgi:hypothetical protein